MRTLQRINLDPIYMIGNEFVNIDVHLIIIATFFFRKSLNIQNK